MDRQYLMDADHKEKQQYLFKEIIEKNYDPEQFQEFLTAAKQGGDDLANWPLPELKEAVANFQKQFDKEEKEPRDTKSEEQQRRTLEKNALEEFIQAEEDKGSKLRPEAFDEIDYENPNEAFKKQVECQSQGTTTLQTVKGAQVAVTKFQKREGGMFEQSYVAYFVQTAALGNKTVERRYSDFQWLKEVLQWLHPGLPVPPIAKKGQFRRYDDKHLKKRMMILEMFLNRLLEVPELRAEPAVENFLKLDDKVAFEKFKATYVRTQKIVPFKNVKTTSGHINLGFDPKTNSFLHRTQKHITQVQPTIKKYPKITYSLYKEFKGAATSLELCGETLKGIAEQCQALDQVDRAFRKGSELSYCPNNFFTLLSETMTRLAGQITNQARIFRTEIYSLLKYQSLYMLNILDGFDSLAAVQQKYQDAKTALTKKKLKLFQQGNADKWELDRKVDRNSKADCLKAMLPRETAKLGKIRDVYGLFNHQMYDEVFRYFSTKNMLLANRLQTTCRSQTRLCTEMMMIWVDAQTNIIGINENKSIIRC